MFGNKMNKVARAIEKGKPATLVELVHNKDENVRIAAIDGLGKLRSGDGVNPLVNLLRDPSAQIRQHAAQALGEIGDVHAKAHIANVLLNEKDTAAKAAMQAAVIKLKDY